MEEVVGDVEVVRSFVAREMGTPRMSHNLLDTLKFTKVHIHLDCTFFVRKFAIAPSGVNLHLDHVSAT